MKLHSILAVLALGTMAAPVPREGGAATAGARAITATDAAFEPGSYVLMLAGLGAIGALIRRRVERR